VFGSLFALALLWSRGSAGGLPAAAAAAVAKPHAS
jgi:hypothetical protein